MKINIQLFGGRGTSSGLYSFYLPKYPKKSKRFEDITHPKQRENSDKLTFKDKETGLEIEFHPKQIKKAAGEKRIIIISKILIRLVITIII